MPLAEVQARWVASLLTGEVRLPEKAAMQAGIKADQQALARRYKQSPRHTIQVDFYPYKRSIEQEMKRMRNRAVKMVSAETQKPAIPALTEQYSS